MKPFEGLDVIEEDGLDKLSEKRLDTTFIIEPITLPVCNEHIRRVLPTPLCPNNFNFIRFNGVSSGHKCSIYNSRT